MKTKLLLTLATLILLTFSNRTLAQSVTVLADEDPAYEEGNIYSGDFNQGFMACNYNKAKGMLSITAEMQSDNFATWNEIRVAFYYNGSWYKIYELWTNTAGVTNVSPAAYSITNFTNTATTYSYYPGDPNRTKIGEMNYGSTHQNVFLYNNGNLKRYNGNYLPIGGDVQHRMNTGDNANYSLQTLPYASNQSYPGSNPGTNGNPIVTTGFDITHVKSFGNLPGYTHIQRSPSQAIVNINVTNLPIEMLESASFRVHIYANANTAHDRIYETVYNNPNFMTSPPTGLTATQNVCGKVTLNWGNAANVLPTDGTVTLKTAIFRNGIYLATVNNSVTSYDDLTAAQDVTYGYTLRHLAFSESGHTYYRTNPTSAVTGQVKPSPDQPISPTASINKCTGEIDLGWSYNGVNPQKFRIDRATSLGGTYTTITNTLVGTERNYTNTGVTRGVTYYYKIYAISNCNVVSLNAATCNGISPADPAMATGVTATTNTLTNSINVTWNDIANNEDKYEIVRVDDQGNTVLTQSNPNTTSYNDNTVANCRLYTYKIKVYNSCVLSGIISTSSASATLPPPNLNVTFDATHKLTCSKGYFGNRVELNWSNNNANALDNFKIYRKQLGTVGDSVQITSISASNVSYTDNTADARIFYQYFVVGTRDCNGTTILSNITTDVGFRNPTGLVSGHIEYNGGVAVSGAKVFVQQSGALTGNSLNFTGGTLSIGDDADLEPGSQMRMEFWVKPSSANASFVNKSGAFSFVKTGANYVAQINTGSNINVSTTALSTGQWNQVSIVYNGSALKLFVNGAFTGSTSATGSITNNTNPIVFGNGTSNFKLDEFRLLGLASSDSVIIAESGRILNGDELGFKTNLHFDEAVGSYAYDPSKVANIFNGNHGLISGSVVWDTDKPSSSQLGYFGVTNALGNYTTSGIRYSGTGENFSLVPSFQTHSFSPNSRSVYIGDASYIYNNQDFLDNSSFSVTGTLFYKNTSCPVPDASLKIDGVAVISNGLPVVTDAAGSFSISVPIGNHFVTVEKNSHTMQDGRYPPTGVHNFQAPVPGIQFIDSTTRMLVGRVVGGLVETNKAPGMGRSKNNIGNARIKLVSPIAGTPCYTVAVQTNSLTGEYKLNVPPLQYRIDSVYVITNSVTINNTSLTNANQVIDLTLTNVKTTVIDTLLDNLGGVVNIDSIKYHKRHDMTYRIAPSINVTRLDGSLFIGEDSLLFGATKMSIRPTGAGWGSFGYPVFIQDKTYSAKIHGSEIYTNTNNGNKDTVRLSGNVFVTNDMVDGTDPNPSVPMVNGTAVYTFKCGQPNNATNAINPALDYTKDMQIIVVPDGAASVMWKPNLVTMPTAPNYHTYVFGQKITGTGVSTQGPEKVDFILRDPPGSGSSSQWGTGTTVNKTTAYSKALSEEAETTTKLLLGKKALIGIGVINSIEIDNSIGLGFSNTYQKGTENSYSETMTTFNTVATRDDPDNVGAPADVFIGRAKNWLVGPTNNIELKTVASCLVGGNCFGPVVNGYQLAKTVGYAIAPDGVRTRFSYTQNEIETIVIPGLESVRASFLLNNTAKYTSHLPASHPLFGINNDDVLLATRSTTTSSIYENADTTGTSYTVRWSISKDPTKNTIDSVRVINTQIALWKRALAQNEREKYKCKNHIAGTLVDNFTLGSAIVANSYSTDQETTSTETYELALGGNAKLEIGAQFGGTGFLTEIAVTLLETKGNSTANGVTTSTSFEYTLTDGDPGDIMSIDVYKSPEGTGNVFITRGGQTMCPYEDAVTLHYYNPGDPTAEPGSHSYNAAGYYVLANSTVQREMPNIAITPAIQYNIPSNQAASYQLVLSNQSPLTVNNDIDMQVRVASVSNPNGAVLKIDGNPANTVINIPSGGSVVKTLTIERGPIEIEYDSLMVIFSSACSEDIADTSYVTVHFIPTCTDLALINPTNNWIINNGHNNVANIRISNYNYNYGTASVTSGTTTTILGFNNIGVEFRPLNSNVWTAFNTFYKYPSALQDTIPNNQVYSEYAWNISTIPDGNYELRALSNCLNKDGSFATVSSPVFAGIMDRINPSPFGTPTPGDGILDPNDDISIQFNEPIDISSLSLQNFDVRGVLNGTDIRHSESLNFDGASDYAEVSGGASLQKRNFTVEFWAKLNATNINQVVLSQGTDPVQNMSIGFDNANKLKFTLGNQTALSTSAISLPTDWHHYAVVYDYANTDAMLYVDGALAVTNNNFVVDYTGSGKIVFGKALPSNTTFLNGNIHDIRLWNKTRTVAEITMTMNKVLNRNQSGLLYNWKMDEADGSVSKDDIRSRNADIHGATWEVNPNGNAAQFDGIDDNVKISSSIVAINKEMDFTLEFWFNSNQSSSATLFSNGKGDGIGADSLVAWNIEKDATGKIHVKHKGLDFVATTTNYFDGTWHHLALVMQRSGNLSAYIDGNLQNSVQANSFNNLAGAYMYLGARGYDIASVTNYDNHFAGKIDEFRLWNTSRKTEQIKRDKQNRMLGDEYGLLAFVPFEHYAMVLGTPSLTPTFNNQSVNTLTVTPQNGTQLITQTPTIKLPRPVQTVNYSWSLNNDKIILTTTSSPELIENVTLDVTVKNAYDIHGNKMQSPKTWIAYINKNQVKWQDDQFSFEKTVDSVITFTAPIVNSGGALKAFTIDGLPNWMTANITSGNIAPNSTQNIVFTISAGGSIGDYNADISVTTDFNYAEILQVNLKVKGVVPTWSVNPSNFQYSMNIFGQMKIDNVMATNVENKIAAFNNGVICGVANLQYIPAYDRYEAFLNVYSNTITGDSIRFNIYDAASGLTFVNVTPSIMFVENDVVGTITNPVTFIANTEIARNIPLNTGWTWISLPLKSNKLANSNLLMSTVAATTGDVIRSNSSFDQYDAGSGWIGNISQGSGFFNNQSYKIKSAHQDTLVHIGTRINPDSTIATINVVPGWNWVGYVATKNVLVNEALGNYNAATGDLIKSQYEFAYYDNLTGWTGSLTHMKPTMGYMLKSTATSSFHYPLSSFVAKQAATEELNTPVQTVFPFTPEMYDNTMSVIITGNICDEALEQGNVVVGAFDVTNTLRGCAYPIKNTTTNKYNFYLTAYSTIDGESLQIKYFNTTNGTSMSTSNAITFATNDLVGNPSNPVIANVADSLACNVVNNTTALNELDNSTNISVYPNPFSDNLTLRFNKALTCHIELMDMLGKVIFESSIKNKKEYNLDLDANKISVASGMYYIRLTGDINQQIKLVKTK